MKPTEALGALPERIGTRAVLRLAWPVMISMLSYTAAEVVDTIFVARLGTASVAGIGLAIPMIFCFQAGAMGLLLGARVAIAQHTGAGEHDEARRLAWQAVGLALVLGLLIAASSFLAPLLFGWVGAEPRVAEEAASFFAIRVLGAPLYFLTFALQAWFQGRGDMRTPMVATLIANGVNLLLDPVLIYGLGPVPALRLGGAALATIIGVGVGVAFLAWRAAPALRGLRRRLEGRLLGEIWHLGLPIAARQTAGVASFTLFTALLAREGPVELAAHVLAFRIVSVSFLPGHAVGEAAGVLVGQAIGAGRPDLARQAWRQGAGVAVAIMGAFGVVFLAIPGPLVGPFGVGPEVTRLTMQLLAIAAVFQVADAVAMVGINVLNGAGDTRRTMAITISASWLVLLPLAWLFTAHWQWGAQGAWWALTGEITAIALLVAWRIRGEAWLTKGVTRASPEEARSLEVEGKEAAPEDLLDKRSA